MGEGTNTKTLVVAIVTDSQSCSAVPLELLANVGDTVNFQNLTDFPVVMFFPNASLFGHSVVELGPGDKNSQTVGNVDFGSYQYTVFCKGKEEFMDKAARPRIIVYRLIP